MDSPGLLEEDSESESSLNVEEVDWEDEENEDEELVWTEQEF